MIWKGCVLIIVRVESYERFDWLMGLWGKFAMSTEMFSGLILITGSNMNISTAVNIFQKNMVGARSYKYSGGSNAEEDRVTGQFW